MAKNPLHFDDEPLILTGKRPSFGDILSEYEQGKSQPRDQGNEGREGTVVAVSPESVFVDIGFKIEGVIEAAVFDRSSSETRRSAASLHHRPRIRKATTRSR